MAEFGGITVHHADDISFIDDQGGTSRWMKVLFTTPSQPTADMSVFYGAGLEPEKVCRAMAKFLRDHGYLVGKNAEELIAVIQDEPIPERSEDDVVPQEAAF